MHEWGFLPDIRNNKLLLYTHACIQLDSSMYDYVCTESDATIVGGTGSWKKRCLRLLAALCSALGLILIVSGVVSAIVMSVVHQTWDDTSLAYQGDTIKLALGSGFWYEYYEVVQEPKPRSDYPHDVQLYRVPSHRMLIRTYSGRYESEWMHLPYRTRMLASRQYLWLMKPSVITYSLCLWANGTVGSKSAEFFVFDSLPEYQNFVDEFTDGSDAVSRHQLNIGTEEEPACSNVIFQAGKDAYYFMSAQCPEGVSYQYNISSLVKYVNYTDYEDLYACTVGEDHSCKVALDDTDSIFGSASNVDLLAYVVPFPPYLGAPPTTHVKVTAVKRYTILIIPSMMVIVGILLLVATMTACLVTWKRRRYQRHGYVAIRPYYG